MQIPEAKIDDIRSQANIVDIISEYTQLKKSGKNYMGLCPFHDERTPSFSVVEEDQYYHCFSCKRAGNVFNFLMEVEGLSFPQAVARVADLAKVDFDLEAYETSGRQSRESQEITNLKEAHDKAESFYHHILMNTKIGQEPLAYLTERGLKKETLESFQIGYSPPQKLALHQYLKGEFPEANPDFWEKTGLFNSNQAGDYLDRFAERIVFPIQNEKGQTVAFSGRFFGEEDPEFKPAKYVNSPETILFNKSQILFNFNRARGQIRRQKEVFVFEGYMDVMAAHQAGVENGVASMGTSLTDQQLGQLRKVCDRIVLAYDGDQAGLEATRRAIDLIEGQGHFTIDVLSFPPGQDPDDFIQANGEDAFQDFAKHQRKTTMGFFMDYYRQGKNLANEAESLQYIEEVLQALTRVPSALERELYFNELADEFDLSKASLQAQFEDYQESFQRQRRQERKEVFDRQQDQLMTQVEREVSYSRSDNAERAILKRLFDQSDLLDDIQLARSRTRSQVFHNPQLEAIYQSYCQYMADHDDFVFAEFLAYFDQASDIQQVISINELDLPSQVSDVEVADYFQASQLGSLEERLAKMQKDVEQLTKIGQKEEALSLLQEQINLKREIEHLKLQ